MFQSTDTVATANAADHSYPAGDALTVGDLAWMIATDGPDAHEQAILAAASIAQTLNPVLCSLVIDDRQEPIVRARAYGRLAVLLGSETPLPAFDFDIAHTPALATC
jgi:hypothetical protein